MEKTISVGLIGIGNMGSAHASAVGGGRIRGLRLAAVCDIDEVRLKLCMEKKLQANRDYADRLSFGRKCLMNIASAAKFSSDRTIRQYAEEIWHIEPTQY